jgi:hypothetical protein
MIMNRKIFTLLACALMLFSTAFTINAKVVGGNLAVGDTVRSLPEGKGKGMYHIRIDSIYVNDGGWRWRAVGGVGGYQLPGLYTNSSYSGEDTVILAVTEGLKVIPVSANDLRHGNYPDIKYTDLQSTMWCINIVKDPLAGQMPTFHFTNKVFDLDLDFETGRDYVSGNEQGWMYSPSFDNGQLNASMPLRRLKNATQYTVLVYETSAGNGSIVARDRSILDFVNGTAQGMLKFTIVEVAPVLLDADAFNTQLGESKDGLVKLEFDPEPNSTAYSNYFGYPLKAVDDEDYGDYGYLNLYINGSDTVIYNIANTRENGTGGNQERDRYTNELGVQHLRILADGKYDPNLDNNSYRFVYFPSRDSLVINAFEVGHAGHNSIVDRLYTDKIAESDLGLSSYVHDVPGATPLYYGLYTAEIQDRLIVRLQDLYGVNAGTSLMTIGQHPANTRISFGISGCAAIELEAWTPDPGIYTIWDDRGRMLGVRPYNGALAAQWIQLRPGECPDRIPSYQWVIEKATVGGSKTVRVNITSREFGDLTGLPQQYLKLQNVLIKKGSSPIFMNQGQFFYHPFVSGNTGYEAINHVNVTGQYLAMDGKAGCLTVENSSGFRPVKQEWVADEYLGYKHFYVNTDVNSPSFGKSDDVAGPGNITEKGMDYNAFAFNYLHEYGDDRYIDLKKNVNDSVLYISQDTKKGFQFQLGTEWRSASTDFKPTPFGYPTNATNTYDINSSVDGPIRQVAPRLKRYFYELKVADFYNYRDGLAEQFVVLKGASDNGLDIANKFNYGVADVWADTDPFKFANVYLRETYFIEKYPAKTNEERKSQDPSRRTYYAIIDRIESDQFDRLGEMGYEIQDSIRPIDASSFHGLMMFRVDPVSGIIRGVTKTTTTEVLSTFALENVNYPLYRRLCSEEDDGAKDDLLGYPCPYDAPKTLRFHKQTNDKLFLYEDAISSVSDNLGINFLGQANSDQFKENIPASDGTYKYNYNLFVDTAYINRGTGWIKPQYLIAVGCDDALKEQTTVTLPPDEECLEEQTKTILPYIRGRYLINATDSAREIGSNGAALYPKRDDRYITSVSWNRLAFVDAIHVDDRLYIVSQLQKAGIPESDYTFTVDGISYVDGLALREMTKPGGVLAGTARKPDNSMMYGSYYDFGDWQNYHNDVCFSLRFVNANALNASEVDGTGGSDNKTKAFMIESETTDRNPYGNRKIAPVQGGWIVVDNGVPAVSHIAYEAAIGQAEVFNVEIGAGEATSNDPVSLDSSVKVISGTDEISVLNVAGKQVTITNLLGQTIVNFVPNSDNVTVKAPKGVVIVTVKGEKAVKSIVK